MKINNLFNYNFLPSITKNFNPNLTIFNKKINVIALLALGSLALCYAVYKFIYKKTTIFTKIFLSNAWRDLPVISSDKIIATSYPSISPNDMQFPIMQGCDTHGRKMIALRMKITISPAACHHLEQEIREALRNGNDNIITERVLILFEHSKEKSKQIWQTSMPGFALPVYPFLRSGFDYYKNFKSKEDLESLNHLQTLIKDKKLNFQNCLFELY